MLRRGLIIAYPAVLSLVMLVAGMALGRWYFARPVKHQLDAYHHAGTLGSLLQPEEKPEYARAFYSPVEALREMDGYSYSYPMVVTPFVGSGPRPGRDANAHVNALQFRSEQELALPKPAAEYRIFLVGGSTAFGSGAPSEERTIGGYLEALLNEMHDGNRRIEVYTFANPGWVSTHERISIVNRLSELAPDLIVSLSGSNDVFWSRGGWNTLWMQTYADQHFGILIDNAMKLAGYEASPPLIIKEKGPVPPEEVARRLVKNVRQAAFSLTPDHIPYLFALQPNYYVTGKGMSARELRIFKDRRAEKEYYQGCYEAISRELDLYEMDNFRFINLAGVFDEMAAEDEVFLDLFHFGDRGNEVIARGLLPAVDQILVESEEP